jgi:hypothetical protein
MMTFQGLCSFSTVKTKFMSYIPDCAISIIVLPNNNIGEYFQDRLEDKLVVDG